MQTLFFSNIDNGAGHIYLVDLTMGHNVLFGTRKSREARTKGMVSVDAYRRQQCAPWLPAENGIYGHPVFATPILTTSWLALNLYPASEWDFIPAPLMKVPRLMNLQKIYGFNEPFPFYRFLNRPVGVSIINISIRKTRSVIL